MDGGNKEVYYPLDPSVGFDGVRFFPAACCLLPDLLKTVAPKRDFNHLLNPARLTVPGWRGGGGAVPLRIAGQC